VRRGRKLAIRHKRPHTELARKLRRDSTEAEKHIWHILRAGNLAGLKFRRQHPIGSYVADFCCPSRRLVVELDGGQHANREAADDERTAYLRARGYRVIRFWNNEVLGNKEGVLAVILTFLGRKDRK
jgi:very-short-patch-repair endonuclease